jgi:hypothetical protein
MNTEPAKLSAARFLESHFKGRACDHEAVSECLRCNALFLANETLKPQASNEAHGWRPIESAPRDGTWILAYGTTYPGQEAFSYVAKWSDDGFGGKVDMRWCIAGSYDNDAGWERVEATHWQPLPEPPQPIAGDGEGPPCTTCDGTTRIREYGQVVPCPDCKAKPNPPAGDAGETE